MNWFMSVFLKPQNPLDSSKPIQPKFKISNAPKVLKGKGYILSRLLISFYQIKVTWQLNMCNVSITPARLVAKVMLL